MGQTKQDLKLRKFNISIQICHSSSTIT